jgi:Zn-dependent protease/CBS domain-containing protein
MKWSWKIGQLAGIGLRIHATFLLLPGWVLVSYWMAGKSVDAVLAGVVFIVAFFACLAFHEIGHAIMARRFGIQTRDITLLPIGGAARLERAPEVFGQELCVALAGPAMNLAIAALLCGWLTLVHQWEPLSRLGIAKGPFVERLLMANSCLVLVNLIPAFPMDGGRGLRALLTSLMTYPEATQFAASAGQALALTLGFVGLFTNPLFSFIGLFVWIGASQEACAAQLTSALSGTPARAAMLTDFETLGCSDTLADAVRTTLRGSQHDFPVLDRDRVVGILTRTDLLVALTDFGPDHPVASVMRREFLRANRAEMLEPALRRLRGYECHTMPVIHDGRLVGLITMDNLGEYLLTHAALRESGVNSGRLKRVPGVVGNRRNLKATVLKLIHGS